MIFAYLLARPEAIFIITLFFLEIAVYMLIYNRFSQKQDFTYTSRYYIKLTQLLGISLVLFTTLSLWRYHTFGQIFPQPVYAKSTNLPLSNLSDGIEYLFQQYWKPSLAILTGLVILGMTRILRHHLQNMHEQAWVIISLFFLAQMAFIVTKGNDWMPGGRFFVHILPLLVIAGLYVIHQCLLKIAPIILVLLSLTALVDNAHFNKYHSQGTFLPLTHVISEPVINHLESAQNRFHWSEKVNRKYLTLIPPIIMLDKIIPHLLEIKSSLTIVSGEMGMIPFYIAQKYFGKVKFIDLYGLTTHHLTTCDLEKYSRGKLFASHLFRGRFGIQVSPWFLLHNLTNIQKNCPVPIPDSDIVCGLGTGEWMNDLKEPERKHRLIYRQSGSITTGDCWSRQNEAANYFIAIHQDLLAKTNKLQLESYKLPQVSCQMKRSW